MTNSSRPTPRSITAIPAGRCSTWDGEVIGINNQIFSDWASSGSIGLGFAIPSNDMKFLVEQIRDYGRPHLGWLGLRVQTLTLEMADLPGAAAL